jgi:colanic acid biosynthesis glycosyl transferase WcaI
MHVIVVSAVFTPEPVVSAQTSAHIAEGLVQRGHRVSVLTSFPNRPAGRLHPGYSRRPFQREGVPQGFEITRCFSMLSPTSSLISRFMENVSFGVTSSWALMLSSVPDVVYANTWPIFALGMLYSVCQLRRIPLVVVVQDVYPESLVAQQRIEDGGLVARWMRWVDGLIARSAQAVLVLSERFARIYQDERRVASGKVHVIPNWLDENSIVLDAQHVSGLSVSGLTERFRADRGIPPGAFLLAYGGNIGVAAGLEMVIEAFTTLEANECVYLLVAGEGSRLAACQALARACAGRVVFHTPWPVEETSQLLRSADVLVLPTRGAQSLASVPSKLVAYMLAARPVIALALPDSEVANMVERAGCGWVVEPDRPERLVEKIREVKTLFPDELARRGQAGRKFALQNLSRSIQVPRVLDILERAAGPSGADGKS